MSSPEGSANEVALGRLLHQQPELVLADEPLSALDPRLAEDVLNTLLLLPGCLISLHRPDLIHRLIGFWGSVVVPW